MLAAIITAKSPNRRLISLGADMAIQELIPQRWSPGRALVMRPGSVRQDYSNESIGSSRTGGSVASHRHDYWSPNCPSSGCLPRVSRRADAHAVDGADLRIRASARVICGRVTRQRVTFSGRNLRKSCGVNGFLWRDRAIEKLRVFGTAKNCQRITDQLWRPVQCAMAAPWASAQSRTCFDN